MIFEIKKGVASAPLHKQNTVFKEGQKKCPKCEQVKDRNLFSKNKVRKDGLDCWCKECINSKTKVYHKEHRPKRLAQSKQWAQDNPERMAQLAKDWRAQNLDRANENRIRWRKENPDRSRFLDARRHAAELRATPAWADEELMALIFAEAEYRGMHVDHIVPLQGKNVCGLHVYYNTQLLTKSENSEKGNKWPYEPKAPL